MKNNIVEKKITKVGNSYAVLLPKEFVSMMDADLGDVVKVEFDEEVGQITITNKDDGKKDPFESKVVHIIEQYLKNKNSGKE